MAFTVLTAVYKVVHSQFVRDQCVHRLLSVMRETYDLITSVEGLKKIESQAKTITSLAHQTVECSYFIREYMKSKGGWKNCIPNAWSNIDAQIQGYEATFKELKNALHNQTAIQTHLYVVRLHDLMLDLAVKTDLENMHYAVGASYKSQKSHEVGIVPSRMDIMESIASWVNQDTGPQICLLLGPQESEKSTIAHTIAYQFDSIKRLGSSYFFSCAAQDKRNATNLFSTIAFDLAHHDPQYMKALWDVVKDDRTLRETDDPLTQFTSFILAPAKQMTCYGPVLVVIDGLEYSGSKSADEGLLNVLAEKGAELPLNFKFLITCRPDEDIHAVFGGKSHIVQEHLSCRIGRRTSTSTLDSSGSSTLFSAQDNAGYSFSESFPSSISIHEEPRPLKSVVEVLQMVSTTVEISERGRCIRRIQSQNFESWTVEQRDHQQRSLSLDIASVMPAGDLPLTAGSTYSPSDPPPPYAG
ncbi:hypothetical protein K503DRAFT_798122 [Rhizopogon vinicolor AM-OR11-026]|uniref:Nephrocystin 3-like N-terminal domain-containing protein n=1 Tax=Rhizopogon vinicolor AM-OR11-026 TaxID=1314800 RepID=A0A1B7N8V8_9AGAM|nr:hypothetical protein K503DRAFT_798122 [Rhizopogon vinicolor AM-OR11-026]